MAEYAGSDDTAGAVLPREGDSPHGARRGCLDGHSRKVLGYSVADHIGAAGLVTEAIDSAVTVRDGGCRGTVLHSNRGGGYTATLTARACFRYGLRRSMGATGICWDNSPAELFWSTFKHEKYYRHDRTGATIAALPATCKQVCTSLLLA